MLYIMMWHAETRDTRNVDQIKMDEFLYGDKIKKRG